MSVPQRPGPCPHCDDDHVKAACLAPFGVYGGCRSARVAFDAGAAWAEVERLKAAQVWQPIETAVFNKRLMLWLDGRAVSGTREGGAGELPRRVDPTHWMPLPKGPTP